MEGKINIFFATGGEAYFQCDCGMGDRLCGDHSEYLRQKFLKLLELPND